MFILHQVVDANLEKDAKSLAGKDGWIVKHDFIKYAFGTDLCKDESHDRVFHKCSREEVCFPFLQ